MFRDRGPMRGKGKPMEAGSSSPIEQTCIGNEDRGRRPYTRGQGGSRVFEEKCFKCNQIGNKSYECLDNATSQRNVQVVQTEDARVETHAKVLELRESLMLKRVMLKPQQ